MELRQLHAFLAVAEELHFGRAAQRLHIAQSPLSQMIRALERDLGAPLFVRTTRSVQLTAAGTALLAPARVIAAQVQVARTVVRSTAARETGVASVGFGGASGYTVRHESLMVAVPTGHRLADRRALEPADLAGERLVVYPAAHGSLVRDATFTVCASAGFAPTIAREAPDPYSLLALVGAGVGIAVVVASTAHITVDGVRYIPLDGGPVLPIALAWRQRCARTTPGAGGAPRTAPTPIAPTLRIG